MGIQGLFALCLPRSRLRAINTSGCYKVDDTHIRHAFSNLSDLRTYIHISGFRKYVPPEHEGGTPLPLPDASAAAAPPTNA